VDVKSHSSGEENKFQHLTFMHSFRQGLYEHPNKAVIHTFKVLAMATVVSDNTQGRRSAEVVIPAVARKQDRHDTEFQSEGSKGE